MGYKPNVQDESLSRWWQWSHRMEKPDTAPAMATMLPHGLKTIAHLTPVLWLMLQNLHRLSEMPHTRCILPATNPTDLRSISPEKSGLFLIETCLIPNLQLIRHMFCRRFDSPPIRFRAYAALSKPHHCFRITEPTNDPWPLAQVLSVGL